MTSLLPNGICHEDHGHGHIEWQYKRQNEHQRRGDYGRENLPGIGVSGAI